MKTLNKKDKARLHWMQTTGMEPVLLTITIMNICEQKNFTKFETAQAIADWFLPQQPDLFS